MTTAHTLACNPCQVIGPRLDRTPSGVRLTDRDSWGPWLDEHTGHDVRMLVGPYDDRVPLPGWVPRYRHGPPDPRPHDWAPPGALAGRVKPGDVWSDPRDQAVACPNCTAGHEHSVPTTQGFDRLVRGTVARMNTTNNLLFVYCRVCGHTWGPAAEDAYARDDLRKRAPDDEPGESPVWPLQRLGLTDQPTH